MIPRRLRRGSASLNLLVTDVSGFIGSVLLSRLTLNDQYQVKAALRRDVPDLPERVAAVKVGDMAPETDWQAAVSNVDVVIHTAARVHVMKDTVAAPLVEFRLVNVDGTLALARQVAERDNALK